MMEYKIEDFTSKKINSETNHPRYFKVSNKNGGSITLTTLPHPLSSTKNIK